jgi:TonB-dependent receptor
MLKMLNKKKLPLAIAGVISTFGGAQAIAQDQVMEEVVITGIRSSMQKSLDVKRDGTGVVDAITAEDIGKMPDTNLAESLQRITGVSINRVNGEGSEVTVRGFGGNYNLVTVNGRQMPSANVKSITGNPTDQGNQGVSRSFDFSNLASEGVSGIQVYKTGQAAVPTGGIGATINIETIKPLVAGNKLSLGIKAVEDTGGDDTTAEASGLFSWANDEGTLGVAVFGSYQERDSGSRHISVEDWFPATWSDDTAAGWA